MKLLMLGGTATTQGLVRQLLGRSAHEMEWRESAEDCECNLKNYDMLLVDSTPGDCAATARLVDMVQLAQLRHPDLKILVLSRIGEPSAHHACHTPAPHSCGVSESDEGVWQVRCRLKELAWSETAALLEDAIRRPAMEPVVFEYQG